MVKSFQLKFFDCHLARSALKEDHHHVIAAAKRLHFDYQLIEGDMFDAHEPPGRKQSMTMSILRASEWVSEVHRHGGCLAPSRQYGNALLGVRRSPLSSLEQ